MLKQKRAELKADEEKLYAEQSKVGWRQAVEAERKASMRVARVRHALAYSKPKTIRETALLLDTFAKAEDMKGRTNNERAPYGFAYRVNIARNVVRFPTSKAT